MAFRLPRLRDDPIVSDGKPTFLFKRWWQSVVTDIEATLNSLQDAVDAIEAAQAAAAAANAAAAAADAAAADAGTAATSAQSAADAVAAEQALINSYVTGLTLSAADAGADATITISAHTRVYGDGTSLAVAGGSITGIPYSALRYIYYVDATRADTTPSYLATASEATAAQLGDTHLVGGVTTPAALGAPSDGVRTRPPGIGTLE